jgi:alpha-beta hydrolase superfamily lysophospholipase
MKKYVGILFFLLVLTILGGCASVQDSLFDAGIRTERFMSDMHGSSVTVKGRADRLSRTPGYRGDHVLLHGFGSNKDTWVRFTRSLPGEYHVIAFDLPGHGDSTRRTTETYTIGLHNTGIRRGCRRPETEPLHLAGNSMGGWVGMLYTNRNRRVASRSVSSIPQGPTRLKPATFTRAIWGRKQHPGPCIGK